MSRRVPLRPRGGVPVRLAPLEALRGELVGGQAAGTRREAARDHDRLLSVPRLVVRHDPDVDKSTIPKNKRITLRKYTLKHSKTLVRDTYITTAVKGDVLLYAYHVSGHTAVVPPSCRKYFTVSCTSSEPTHLSRSWLGPFSSATLPFLVPPFLVTPHVRVLYLEWTTIISCSPGLFRTLFHYYYCTLSCPTVRTLSAPQRPAAAAVAARWAACAAIPAARDPPGSRGPAAGGEVSPIGGFQPGQAEKKKKTRASSVKRHGLCSQDTDQHCHRV